MDLPGGTVTDRRTIEKPDDRRVAGASLQCDECRGAPSSSAWTGNAGTRRLRPMCRCSVEHVPSSRHVRGPTCDADVHEGSFWGQKFIPWDDQSDAPNMRNFSLNADLSIASGLLG
jgi:hypothetical protein